MQTSIIIPIFNKLEFTKACLESIHSFGADAGHDFEVIVVDNASTDGSDEYLKGLSSMLQSASKVTSAVDSSVGVKLMVIHNEKNLGFAVACNQGAMAAKGEYLLFLNNDTVVTKGWLDVLVDELDGGKDKRIAIVGPKLLYPDGTIQHAGVVFDEKKWPHHIYKREPGDAPYVNKKRKFQCLTAACFLIRARVFASVGGFDEAYLNGLEDADLCLKVGELGYGILYCPASVVYHHESITEGRSNHDEKNLELFYSRWSGRIVSDSGKYNEEDGMPGMGAFLDVWTNDRFSRRRLSYLFQRFMTIARRDGYVRAVAKSWRRFTIRMPSR